MLLLMPLIIIHKIVGLDRIGFRTKIEFDVVVVGQLRNHMFNVV